MKKMWGFSLIFVLIFSFIFTITVSAAEPISQKELPVSAPSAVLMEKETGEILYEKAADERRAPASITKIMTLLLIAEDIESGRLSADDTVSVSRRAASFGGSCVFLEEGERMSVDDMLKCIAVVSANDCAVAMAEHLSGTEQLFVDRMNERAGELGLENTHFVNCTGLFDEKEQYTTARDVALLSRELLRHDMIKKYTTIWMDSIRDGEFELANTNKLVSRYEGCTGLKTGYTSGAKYCLSATAERDGVEFIAVIMGAKDSEQRNSDAASLLNYGFANFTLCPLRPESPLPRLPVELGRKRALELYCDGDEYALVRKGGGKAEYSMKLPDSVKAPVAEGQLIGELRVSDSTGELAKLPVRAAEAVPGLGFFGIFGRLGGSLLGL